MSNLKKLISVLQFLPLAIFVWVARSHGLTESSWPIAFKVGALAAIIQLTILILLKAPINRLIGGANLFLIIGGIGFFFQIESLNNFLGEMRTSGVILAVSVFCLFATFLSPNGVFESAISSKAIIRRYSYIYLVGCLVALFFSFLFKNNILIGGTLPFIFLIVLKKYLQKSISRHTNHDEV